MIEVLIKTGVGVVGSCNFSVVPQLNDFLVFEDATFRVIRRELSPVEPSGWGGEVVVIVEPTPR